MLEVGMLMGVGDDSHAKGGLLGSTDREAHSIDSYRPLLHSDISLLSQSLVCLMLEAVEPAPISLLDRGAQSRHIYMPLDNMPI